MSARAVLVTGGSRGIGAAVARAFAADGDRVAIHHRDNASLASDVHAGLPGDGHVVVQADLADPRAVRRMVDIAAARLDGLDVVVNNAGVYLAHPVTEVSYEEWQACWQETLNVNLLGPANVIWCAARHMTGRGGGRVVNVSSRGAFRGEPRHPAYGASKAGLNALGQSLAIPLAAYGIAIATVAPGFVETDMAADRLDSDEGAQIRAQSPFNRVATPEEIASAVLWLASPEAEWASGAILDLNGASYLRSLPGQDGSDVHDGDRAGLHLVQDPVTVEAQPPEGRAAKRRARPRIRVLREQRHRVRDAPGSLGVGRAHRAIRGHRPRQPDDRGRVSLMWHAIVMLRRVTP